MNKRLKSISKKLINNSAVIFTVTYFLILCFANLTSDTQQAITLKNSALLYLFALLIASCDFIFANQKMKLALKIAIHFVATLISTAAVAAFAGYDLGYRGYLMLMIFILAYAIICPIYVLVGKKYKAPEKADSEYVSIFKKD